MDCVPATDEKAAASPVPGHNPGRHVEGAGPRRALFGDDDECDAHASLHKPASPQYKALLCRKPRRVLQPVQPDVSSASMTQGKAAPADIRPDGPHASAIPSTLNVLPGQALKQHDKNVSIHDHQCNGSADENAHPSASYDVNAAQHHDVHCDAGAPGVHTGCDASLLQSPVKCKAQQAQHDVSSPTNMDDDDNTGMPPPSYTSAKARVAALGRTSQAAAAAPVGMSPPVRRFGLLARVSH